MKSKDKVRKPRITWRKQSNETGLGRVTQSERGATLHVDGMRVATVQGPSRFGGGNQGWFWYGSSDALGIPFKNTSSEPAPDLVTAKRECEAYVRECLQRVKPDDAEPIFKCPHEPCSRSFTRDQLEEDKIPYHDFPEPCRSVCPGARRLPIKVEETRADGAP